MSTEKTFQQELRKDMLECGVAIFKIPDWPVSQTTKYIEGEGEVHVRFAPPKLVDFFGVGLCYRDSPSGVYSRYGVPIFWECKMMKQLRSWPLNTLDDNQLKILVSVSDRAEAAVLINYRVANPDPKTVAKSGIAHLVSRGKVNVLTRVKTDAIILAKQLGWKSLPVGELLAHAVSRPWGGKWNFQQIIGECWSGDAVRKFADGR
jgi:hypothetical protein